MTIKLSHALYTCALGAAIAAACSSSGTGAGADQQALTTGNEDASTSTDAGDAGSPTGPSLAICSDGQAAAIMQVSSQNEIDLANAVMPRLSSATAKTFAQQMITDHTALDQTLTMTLSSEGITSVDNGISLQLRDEGAKAVTGLASLSGSDLDVAYIRHSVLDHVEELGLTDHILTPSIQNTPLIAVSQQARAVVATHLQLATQTQTTLEGSCGGNQSDAGSEAGTSDGGTSDSGSQTEMSDSGSSSDGGGATTL